MANSILAIPNNVIIKLIRYPLVFFARKCNPRSNRIKDAPNEFSIPEIIHPKVVQLANTKIRGEIETNQYWVWLSFSIFFKIWVTQYV